MCGHSDYELINGVRWCKNCGAISTEIGELDGIVRYDCWRNPFNRVRPSIIISGKIVVDGACVCLKNGDACDPVCNFFEDFAGDKAKISIELWKCD
jgi:hypothetical protein